MQPVLILHFTHSVTWSSVGWNVSVSSVSVHVCVCVGAHVHLQFVLSDVLLQVFVVVTNLCDFVSVD